jgi:hypothetical protein
MTILAAESSLDRIAVCRQPVFIIGSPRSGTTGLARALAEHSAFWMSEETVILEHLYGRGRADQAYDATTDPPLRNWFKAQNVDRDEFLAYLGIGINALMTSRSGGRRWIDKTPSYTFITDLLARLFPDALFLHILRDGREVVNSMLHFLDAMPEEVRHERVALGFVPSWARDFRVAAATWRRYVGSAMQFAGDHPARCLTVRLDHLTASPSKGFHSIFRLLQVSPESRPADFFRSTRLASSFRDLPTSPSNPWNTWRREQKRAFIEEAGEAMVQYGLLSPDELARLYVEAGVPDTLSAGPALGDAAPNDGDSSVEVRQRDGDPTGSTEAIEPREVSLCLSPIFVIGAHRSGTSVLAQSLGRHSMLWFSVEGMFMNALYGPDRLNQIYARATERRWNWLVRQGVSYEELAEALGLGLNSLYTSRSGGKRWIEKLPENSLMARTLASMFPGSVFVHILRDGRQAVNSNVNRRQPVPSGKTFDLACHAWSKYARAAHDFTIAYPDRSFTVRYEQLVADPRETFLRIFWFLKVSAENTPLDYLTSERINSSFEAGTDAPSPDPWSIWTDEERQTFLEEAGETMVYVGILTQLELDELRDSLDHGSRPDGGG